MSHRIVLTVDGESRTLLTYHHNYYRQKGKMKSFDTQSFFNTPIACDLRNGYRFDDFEHFSEPLAQVFGGMFYVSFEATDKDDLFYYWMKNSAVLDGRIEFFRTVDEDDIPFQRIDFWDAFLVRIKEQAIQGIAPMTMECDISAAIVRHNRNDATLLRKSWYVTDINEKPVDIYVSDAEEQEIIIIDIYWKYKEKKRHDIFPNCEVSLCIETENFKPKEKIHLLVKHDKNKIFKNNKTQFAISGEVDGNGVLCIDNFIIEYSPTTNMADIGCINFYKENNEVGSLKENFGWQYVSNDEHTHIIVNVEFDLLIDDITYSIDEYKSAINNYFNEVLQISSGNKITGEILFEGVLNYEFPQVVPGLMLENKKEEHEYVILGGASRAHLRVNILKKGRLMTLKEIANTVVHELFHTIRIGHPFEITQTDDTELMRVRVALNRYETTPKTDPNIYYNIMNYGMIFINDKKLEDLWAEKENNMLTPEQLMLAIEEIKLQMQGFGTYFQGFEDFWTEETGAYVKSK